MPKPDGKSFAIPKQLVWEAWRQVKANKGAPGVDGQAEVIATAQALAGIDPETGGYVECHGSATPLGDPIEVAALTRACRAGGGLLSSGRLETTAA